jgi:hypothetical protein
MSLLIARSIVGRLAVVAVGVTAVAVFLPATQSLAAPTGLHFGRAVEIQLPADSSKTPDGEFQAVACTGKGSCVAGGSYLTSTGYANAMVASQTRGHWGRAVKLELPKGALGGQVNGLACPAAGYCITVGGYSTAAAGGPIFAASQARGKWARAAKLKLPGNASKPLSADLLAVSCASRGNCTAVGTYDAKRSGVAVSFLMGVTATHGHWGTAQQIALPANSDPGSSFLTTLGSVSCRAPGDCVAGGGYFNDTDGAVPLSATEAGGHWRTAVPVQLPANFMAEETLPQPIQGISCRAGACTGVGDYLPSGPQKAFAGTGSGGKFGVLKEILAVPPRVGSAAITNLDSVSCPAAGLCVAAGNYIKGSSAVQGMTMFGAGSRMGHAAGITLPLNSPTGAGKSSTLSAVSCSDASYCVTVGYYVDKAHDLVPMAVAT